MAKGKRYDPTAPEAVTGDRAELDMLRRLQAHSPHIISTKDLPCWTIKLDGEFGDFVSRAAGRHADNKTPDDPNFPGSYSFPMGKLATYYEEDTLVLFEGPVLPDGVLFHPETCLHVGRAVDKRGEPFWAVDFYEFQDLALAAGPAEMARLLDGRGPLAAPDARLHRRAEPAWRGLLARARARR